MPYNSSCSTHCEQAGYHAMGNFRRIRPMAHAETSLKVTKTKIRLQPEMLHPG